jgi:hypothetical protein
MRPGLGHLLAGLVLLGGGVAVTLLSDRVVAYGAILVGAYYAIRGAVILGRRSAS